MRSQENAKVYDKHESIRTECGSGLDPALVVQTSNSKLLKARS